MEAKNAKGQGVIQGDGDWSPRESWTCVPKTRFYFRFCEFHKWAYHSFKVLSLTNRCRIILLHENIVILCESNTITGGGVLPYNRLMGICCWMGSHFHYWIDYNGVAYFNRVTRIGSHIFGFFGVRQWLANVPACLYCRWKVKSSSLNLKNGSVHKNRKWLS